jgi:hypothetical protein
MEQQTMARTATSDAANELSMFCWFYDDPNKHLQLHKPDCRHTTEHALHGQSGKNSFWTTPIAGLETARQLGHLLRNKFNLSDDQVRVCPDCLGWLREQVTTGQFTL